MTTGIVCLILSTLLILASSPRTEPDHGRESNVVGHSLDRQAQEPVVVYAGVLSVDTGDPVLNLSADGFLIEEDGQRQIPTRFLREERPLSILLMIDSSGSMRPIIHQIVQGTSQGLKRLKSDDEVALISFNQEVYLLQDFTRDKPLVEKRLKDVIAQRPTLTRQALSQAALHIVKATAADRRRIIVVLTDNLSSTPGDVLSEKVVMQQISASDSVVCGIVVSSPYLELNPPSSFVRPLKKTGDITPYINETGGILESLKDVKQQEVSTKLVKVIDALRSYYRIEYSSTNTKRDGKHRKIKVELLSSVKTTKGKLRVLAKRGYFAPDDTASGDRR